MNAPDDADGSDGAPPENLGERSGALLAALESVDAAIFILGPEFSVRWINGATERYFGLDREAVIGADKRTLIETTIRSIFEDPEAFARTVVDTYEDNTYVEEFECHVLPGEGREERWLRHRSRPIREGDLAGGRVEHYADITDRKRREQELERQNDRLEAFASVVSHDLRNPLSVAEGHLELARQECASEHLERVQGAHDRMNVLIDDLLALAREGEAATDREAVDLAAVVERCWANVETAGATLTVDVDRTVYADESRLQQAFENLVRNAVEHGGESVTVTVGELADGFYVEDDGPGIPAGDRDSVFDVGFSTAGDGTGFGLSIVREIVEAHGWGISVTEGAAGGARFAITGVEFADG
jgi:PAS domain S-box-containing protein